MAEIRLTTAGITLNYAVEATAGTRPTTGYKEIPEITEIPDMSPTPGTIDMTPLNATKYKVYKPDLMDLGGTLSFTANLSQPLKDMWNDEIVGAYETSIATGKAMWFCVIIPDMEDAVYFTGEPSKFGMPGAGVSAGLQVGLPLTPSNEPDWFEKPTVTAPSMMSAPVGETVMNKSTKNVEV